jgi:hypothetical protein
MILDGWDGFDGVRNGYVRSRHTTGFGGSDTFDATTQWYFQLYFTLVPGIIVALVTFITVHPHARPCRIQCSLDWPFFRLHKRHAMLPVIVF